MNYRTYYNIGITISGNTVQARPWRLGYNHITEDRLGGAVFQLEVCMYAAMPTLANLRIPSCAFSLESAPKTLYNLNIIHNMQLNVLSRIEAYPSADYDGLFNVIAGLETRIRTKCSHISLLSTLQNFTAHHVL